MTMIFLKSIGTVLALGLVLGAGLPALFAVGVRSLAWGAGGDAEVSHAAPNPWGKVLAGLCFAVVALVVLGAILVIVAGGFGYVVDFSHVVPVLHRKH